MTFADDFAPLEGGDLDEQSQYPAIFGLSITPTVGGVLCAVLGLAGAAALGWLVVKPAWEGLQELKGQVDTTNTQIAQGEALEQRIGELQVQLQQVKREEQQILSLFASEDKLNTQLRDLSLQVENRQGQLLSFNPVAGEGDTWKPQVIEDGSWGEGVNGKLKKLSHQLEVKGTFNQTLAILRSIEQLKLLGIVANFESQVGGDEGEKQLLRYDPSTNQVVPKTQPKLRTRITLETLVPLSEEELAELATQPAENPEGQAPPQ